LRHPEKNTAIRATPPEYKEELDVNEQEGPIDRRSRLHNSVQRASRPFLPRLNPAAAPFPYANTQNPVQMCKISFDLIRATIASCPFRASRICYKSDRRANRVFPSFQVFKSQVSHFTPIFPADAQTPSVVQIARLSFY
jgi:hypothetical protein